jgi:hypothetical protein
MEKGSPLKPFKAVPSAQKRRRLFTAEGEMKQTTFDMYKPYTKSSKRQQALDFQITMFLVRGNHPFNIVGEQYFKDFIQYLDPRATVKHRTVYSKRKLPLLYENFKRELDAVVSFDLLKVNLTAFTMDFWSCKTGAHFVNLSIHYIDVEWELKHFCAAFEKWEGRTTGGDIGVGMDMLVDLVDGVKPDCHTVCVTDGAANMIAGMRESERIRDHLVCMDHQLQTSLLHAFDDKKSPIVALAIKRATNLASHLHKSNFASNIIKEEAESMKGNGHLRLWF